jgi:hypothetical protein
MASRSQTALGPRDEDAANSRRSSEVSSGQAPPPSATSALAHIADIVLQRRIRQEFAPKATFVQRYRERSVRGLEPGGMG